MSEFSRNLAVIIGINDYHNGISTLSTAVNDAKEINNILQKEHNYQTWILLDKVATLENIKTLLTENLSQQVTPNDRLLFYFAGHGIALNGEDGPEGYLIPQDAKLGDTKTYLSMTRLHSALLALPCRHFLGLLDCCFAGAFRWSSTRDIGVIPEVIYQERYNRFIADPAWQVITSTASDQKAADAFSFQTTRGQKGNHSPFAAALIEALAGKADIYPPSINGKPAGDGVITATELYQYLRDAVETASNPHQRQTPGLWPLKKHDKGEYIFLSPKHPLNLPPAPPLDASKNPYRGLESFDEEHSNLFFGRTEAIAKLYQFINDHTLTVVLGASGSGKSSLVKAGLVSYVKQQSNPNEWQILTPFRPGESPVMALHKTLALEKITGVEEVIEKRETNLSGYLAVWTKQHPESKLLLIIDQLEELMTLCKDAQERENFLGLLAQMITTYPQQLRVIITLRSDFEPQFQESPLKKYWQASRFLVSSMTRTDLREAIEKPAEARVMYFQPYDLVEQLIDEVADMPGSLPLLSFGLSELYLQYLERQRAAENAGETIDRSLTQEDYQALGGVITSLTKRADEEYQTLIQENSAYAQVIRHLMLRMVAIGGGELARRRVLLSELEYPAQKNTLVKGVIERFTQARLLVTGEDAEGNPYVEPAHDVLVRGWQKLLRWKQEDEESLILQRRLTPAAREWESQQQPRFLWHTNPRLDLLKKVSQSDDNWFNKVEAEFIRRSIRRKTFNTRRNWSIAIAVMLGLGAGLIFSLIGYRNTLINEAIASQSSAENSLRLNHSLDGMIDSLQAGSALQHPLVTFPLFKLFRSTDNIQEEIQSTLQWAVYRVKETNRLLGHDSLVRNSISPNNQLIATAGEDGVINLWNLQGQNLASWQGDSQRVWSVAFSPDNSSLASAGEDGTVRLWDLQGKQLRNLQGHTSQVRYVTFSGDGETIASVGKEGEYNTIRLWDRDGTAIASWPVDFKQFAKTVDFHPQKPLIVTTGMDKRVKIWNLQGQNLKTIDFPAWGAFFSADGQYLVAAGDDGTIALWNSQYQLVKQWSAHQGRIWNLTFSLDSQKIASGGEDGYAKIWNLQGEHLGEFQGHTGPVRRVNFTPDGEQLVSSGDDRTTRLWKLPSSPLQEFSMNMGAIKNIRFSLDAQHLIVFSHQGTASLWSLQGQQITQLFQAKDTITHLTLSLDGRVVASRSRNGSVTINSRENNQLLSTFQDPEDQIDKMTLSDDGKLLAISYKDGTINLRTVEKNGTKSSVLKKNKKASNHLNFSADGSFLASAGQDGIITIFDTKTQKLIKTFQGHIGEVYQVNFSPNSQKLVSAGKDKTIRVWDLEQGRKKAIFQTYKQEITSVKFSPDAQTIISGHSSGYLQLWNIERQEMIGVWRGHSHKINSLDINSKGNLLITVDTKGNLKVWQFNSFDELIAIGCYQIEDFLENHSNFISIKTFLCRKNNQNQGIYVNSKKSESRTIESIIYQENIIEKFEKNEANSSTDRFPQEDNNLSKIKQNNSWAGRWNHSLTGIDNQQFEGTMTLQLKNNQVTGTFTIPTRNLTGQITEGEITNNGHTLEGKWSNNAQNQGNFKFILLPNNKEFFGYYSIDNQKIGKNSANVWKATKIEKE